MTSDGLGPQPVLSRSTEAGVDDLAHPVIVSRHDVSVGCQQRLEVVTEPLSDLCRIKALGEQHAGVVVAKVMPCRRGAGALRRRPHVARRYGPPDGAADDVEHEPVRPGPEPGEVSRQSVDHEGAQGNRSVAVLRLWRLQERATTGRRPELPVYPELRAHEVHAIN